jgi:hypothetical protein
MNGRVSAACALLAFGCSTDESGWAGGAGSGGWSSDGGRTIGGGASAAGGSGGGSGSAGAGGCAGGSGNAGASDGGVAKAGAIGGEAAGAGGTAGASDGEHANSNAPVFDGVTGYVKVPDADELSAPTHGAFTVEAWLRPDTTAMPSTESEGYVHWMGKGVPNQHEWVSRMYQDGNSAGRENRISFYAFNLAGGLGAGSYFQEEVTPGAWIHYAGELDASDTYLFKDGAQKDSDPLSGYSITPGNGTAPFRIGTRDFNSFFQGSIARVAIYGARLSAQALEAHHDADSAASYDAAVLSEPSLVGYWRLDEAQGSVAHDATGKHDGSYHGGITLTGATWRQ